MQFLTSLSPIIPNYDAFLVDLWGVLHDGSHLYPGALDALKQIRAAGKHVSFLSNAPRRAEKAQVVLDQLGVDRKLYDALVTSGEAGYDAVKSGDVALGKRYFYIGPPKDAEVLAGLGLQEVKEVADADFVLNVGFGSEEQGMANWSEPLAVAHRHKLPMLCLNPDLEVVKITGERFPCAGVIAKVYHDKGGRVIYFGKPYPEVYHAALKQLGNPPLNRVLAIGDGLHTDILGAKRVGIASLLVTGGILHQVMGEVQKNDIVQYLERQDVQADYVIAALKW